MKIVSLVSSLNSGGAERVMTVLCNAWSARGDCVTLIPTYSGGGKPFYKVSEDVELIYLAEVCGAKGKSPWAYAARGAALRRLIMERQPDVVVSFMPNVNVAATISMMRSNIPLIICERDDPSSRSRRDLWEIGARLVYPLADMFTVQTEAVALKARQFYPGVKKVRAIPNPLAPGIGEYLAEGNVSRHVLLGMGRLVPQKQVHRMIEAFAEVADAFPDWDLHIYGDGPLRGELDGLIASLELRGRVALTGKTSEPWAVMSNADAFVMTSAHEGFPNAMLEAMAVGLPCAVFDCPSGPRELSADGRDALLVPLNDHRGMVRSLETLMAGDELRKTLGSRARRSVRERFNLPVVLRMWDALFEEVGASPISTSLATLKHIS
ncbi:glycosyltransferase family 4 protein [Noviherbaspirillum sp. ST9]|uniref:glycosyltransferase family 4 protein n=1 Tax=Noviherbaspirillum sp. ST9 TaxID=3401606 RepID=UPI003B58A8E5